MSQLPKFFCNLLDPIESDDISVLTKPSAMDDNDDDELVSPFIAYADGYRWPDVFTEIDEMLEANVLIYALAELRRMARADKLDDQGARSILKLPLTHSEVIEIVEANQEKLVRSKFSKEFYLDILKTAEERNMILQHGDSENDHLIHMTPTSIVAFDDEFEKEELVYSIEVNHVRERITVCFRGTITKTDWATNFEIYMKEVSNPLKNHKAQESTVRVHSGFHHYLFEPSSRGAKGPDGQPLSEYGEIMQEHIVPVIKKFPGYKLYVTGHSLGAALATLFAFEAAAAPDSVVPKPVTCISIASPYVGDYSFRSAHQILEGQGKLRHLRISNHKDLVTIIPKFSFRWQVFDRSSYVGSLFKHVGINLRLYDGFESFEVSYPKVRSGFFSSTFDELARGWDQTWLPSNFIWNPAAYVKWPAHSLREYNSRSAANKPGLQSLQLNDMYARQDIVGNLVPQF